MVTYLYWAAVIAAAGFFLVAFGKLGRWKPAIVLSVVVLFIGSVAYYFFFQQVFVKRFGGVMTISVPEGQRHIAATWKDDNLWIENYDPATNNCIFNEYSRGNLLQGKVIIKDCNPIHSGQSSRP